VLDCISQDKDVDGLHPLNVYKLAHTSTHTGPSGRKEFSLDTIDFHVSCTPQVYTLIIPRLYCPRSHCLLTTTITRI
jgi:hypothetical protein